MSTRSAYSSRGTRGHATNIRESFMSFRETFKMPRRISSMDASGDSNGSRAGRKSLFNNFLLRSVAFDELELSDDNHNVLKGRSVHGSVHGHNNSVALDRPSKSNNPLINFWINRIAIFRKNIGTIGQLIIGIFVERPDPVDMAGNPQENSGHFRVSLSERDSFSTFGKNMHFIARKISGKVKKEEDDFQVNPQDSFHGVGEISEVRALMTVY